MLIPHFRLNTLVMFLERNQPGACCCESQWVKNILKIIKIYLYFPERPTLKKLINKGIKNALGLFSSLVKLVWKIRNAWHYSTNKTPQNIPPPAVVSQAASSCKWKCLFFCGNHSFSSQRARGQSATSAGWDCRCTNVSGHDGVWPGQLQSSCGATVPVTLPHGGYRWQWCTGRVHRNQ